MFNFFLVGSGVIANAYGLLLRNPDPFFWQAGAVALVGALVCGVSFVLDMRNRQLVGYGEDALRRVEQDYLLSAAQIKPNSEAPEYAIMTRELRIGKPPPWLKHGNLFKALEVVGALGFLVAGGWSFYMALN
ncbi:MAG: hypothetical protein OXK21_09165 [Chloroflexota bacterium]|nr:hypothetical protein [Chloroflexota bacterium]